MATATPKEGDAYTFVGVPAEAEDDDRRYPLGSDAGALVPGTPVTIRNFVDAGTIGAHDDTEDSVVVEWEAQALVQTDKGIEQGTATRSMSIAAGDFAGLFEKG